VSSESITLEVDSTQQERDDEDIWRTTQESLVGLVPDCQGRSKSHPLSPVEKSPPFAG
jgi:hypothetical protein